jgi:hypothetical protein
MCIASTLCVHPIVLCVLTSAEYARAVSTWSTAVGSQWKLLRVTTGVVQCQQCNGFPAHRAE